MVVCTSSTLMDSILFAVKKPEITAVFLAFLLFLHPFGALAASGGRMGGSDFSSSSDSDSSSYSSSDSLPDFSSIYSDTKHLSHHMNNDKPSPSREKELNSHKHAVKAESEPASVFFLLTISTVAAFVLFRVFHSENKGETSVIKLQVGLLGSAREFQKELDRIAETADTSTSKGWNYILNKTTLALLQHLECCISAYSSVNVKRSIKDGGIHFKELSIEERGKFDEETLVNVNNIKIQDTTNLEFVGLSNEYIVVTILVAAEGVHELLEINSSMDLKEALQKLASIPPSKTRAVDVLWTPQKENDTLSERQYLKDYPLLRPL